MNTNGARPAIRGALHSAATILLATSIAGCGGGDSTATSDVPPGFIASDVTITISPTSLVLVQGKSVTATVTLTRKGSGSQGTIDLVIPGLPTGVTATFNPASLPAGVSSSILTVAAATDANIVTVTPPILALINGDTLAIDGPPTNFTLQIRNARPGIFVMKAGSGSGTVTSAPAGITCGVTCGAQFDALAPITLTAAPATGSVFTSWSGVCVGTTVTCTFTPNDFGNTVTASFTSTAPAIGLSVSPSPVSVQAGANATATVTLARINGFADPVNLTVSGAPAGLTVSPNPTSVTGTTSTLTITAAASLAAGNYPVTITGTGTGVAQQSTTFAVQATPGSAGGDIAFNFAPCETNQIPVWSAVQNGSGPWTRVTPVNNVFTFTIGTTGAIASVTRTGTTTETSILYGTAAEIAAIAIANPCGGTPTGTKHLTGTFANFGDSNSVVNAVIGGAQFTLPRNSSGLNMTNVPKGTRDLIAAKTTLAAPGQDRIILRRGTNYPSNTIIPTLDFGICAADAFTPVIGGVVIPILGTDQGVSDVSLITANGPSASYFSFSGTPGPNVGFAFIGLPSAQLQTGDFHNVSVFAAPSNGTAFRFIELLQHSPSVQTISLGPPLGAGLAVTTLGTAPNLRLRAQIPAQSTYTAGAIAEFSQNANSVSILMSAGYLGTPPATWTLDIPDLSSAGYDATWGLKNGTGASWGVSAVSGNVLPFLGGSPVDNAQIVGAGAQDSSLTFPSAIRGMFVRRRHP
jgi:hypothetical protein